MTGHFSLSQFENIIKLVYTFQESVVIDTQPVGIDKSLRDEISETEFCNNNIEVVLSYLDIWDR